MPATGAWALPFSRSAAHNARAVMKAPTKPLPLTEFVVLIALTVSLVALATDAMLPSLAEIGRDLGVADPNRTQLVVSSLFLGFALGQILVGPLSDSYGRRPVIFGGFAVFIAGCLISMIAGDLQTMLAGRVLQGLGAAAPRVVTVAMVRDGYAGRPMARIMSFVMAVFILVPAIAPAIGQGVAYLAGWRAIFGFFLVLALSTLAWFALRQPETLAAGQRRPFSAASLGAGFLEACRQRPTLGYTLATGCLFGGFLGYLSSARQVFQVTYDTGALFPLYFGAASLAIGAASVLNARLVMRLGMRLLSRQALVGLTLLSALFLAPVLLFAGRPPLWLFVAWQLAAFFCVGVLFGNLNALAMEPLGHMAGLGAALVGSLATLLALPFGWAVGAAFDGTVLPLTLGFLLSGAGGLAAMLWTERKSPVARPG